jgi:hypothetical protein
MEQRAKIFYSKLHFMFVKRKLYEEDGGIPISATVLVQPILQGTIAI